MGLRRLVRSLRVALHGEPTSARDVVKSYGEYIRLQRETYLSHEGDVARWAEGQRRFVEAALGATPRGARVLDCACGDGIGLESLRRLGFADAMGFELSEEKASRARGAGYPVIVGDMHRLEGLESASFDAILSSHTLEHAYDPSAAVAELRRVLRPGGRLHVVLPFPDSSPRNERAHVGKYALGTHLDDEGRATRGFFGERGLRCLEARRDTYREPELWLTLERTKA